MRKKKVYPLFLWMVIAVFSSTAYAEENKQPKLVFKMTQGQGTEVCESYFQRLNANETSDFLEPGTQLFILNKITEPLQKELKPVPLTAEEIQRIYDKIISFTRYKDQNLIEKYKELHKDDEAGRSISEEAQKLAERIQRYINNEHWSAYVKYQEKLDIDNDGIATDTVIHNAYSLYIFDESLQRIDEAKMMAVFADQELLEWPTIAQFPPLAVLTNVFSYKGKYYFDGFLNLVLSNDSLEFGIDEHEPLKIGVFIHQQQKTQKVCEYQILNSSHDYWYPPSYHRSL